MAHVAKGGGIGPDGKAVDGVNIAEPSRRMLDDRRTGGVESGRLAKALAEATGSAGGFLVPQDVADEVFRMVRAQSAVMSLGPRIVGVRKELVVNSVASGATASYVLENAATPVSELTFAQQVILRPKELATMVPVSNRMLRDAVETPAVEELIRQELAEIMASARTWPSSRARVALGRSGSRTRAA